MPLLKGTIIRESTKAICFNIKKVKPPAGDWYPFNTKANKWVPLSQVTSITRSTNLCEDELNVTEWIAEKIGVYDELD